ncbi:methyl-accepting chemotaxis protein [Leptospira stimsonii]|uniref:Methyl-accepting chemotaxis protein n=1 Tax=Leptospira stimsonii TaxID=2202203 RepID=A0A5F1XXN7_9LEPT|nr:methyl-accepting chemotaxis protein [Leptospira stimsonii]RHX86072.1 methyl-accepting chemotaxis protein [Leptospira stimsonii]TGK19804.1 methyl-accepting chemotaxis protein [Leptospira stimsonii]
MESNESRKLRWNLTIGLELMTVAITVPLAVLFIITAGGYDFYKSVVLNIVAILTLTLSYYVSAIRFFYLGRMLKPLRRENWTKLTYEEKVEIKRNLLNFPIFNTIFFIVQWTGGLFQSVLILRYGFGLSFFEIIPFAFLPPIIYPILAVAHFFYTEAKFVPVLEADPIRSIHVPIDQVRKISLYIRTVATIGSIVISPVVVIGYFLVEETAGWIKLQDVFIPLSLTIFFIALTLLITARLFVGSLRRNVANLVNFFEGMSTGKLDDVFPMISSDELGRSNKQINDFVEKLRFIVKKVTEESKNLSESSKRLEENTVSLSKRMQEQAASTEEMSAGVEEMTASIQSTADRAGNQTSVVNFATNSLLELEENILKVHSSLGETERDAGRMKLETANGKQAILGSIQAIEEIKDSSEKMGDTVTVIHDITDRIGLLSLNAAIEAARAGDFGRGFAVVAREISNLGNKTQEKAKSIKIAIAEALSAAKSGSEVIEFTEKTFDQIGYAVDSTIDRISKVTEMSHTQLDKSEGVRKAFANLEKSSFEIHNLTFEQAQTSMEFSKTISTISENTEFLSGIVSEIDVLSGSLASQARRLKQEFEFFKV